MKKYIPTDETDQQDPRYLFSLTSLDLLGAIVKGEIDPVELARKQLENRGYNEDGFWVGFKE
ncbi:MAG TPA: hypothetical protein VF677_05715 [Flavobacterium sp.]|jgi:hypothetical protein